MSAVDETRAAIEEYRTEVANTAEVITQVERDLQGVINLIGADGPLGDSGNRNIRDARERVAMAISLCSRAADEARASRGPVRQLVAELFPP